MEKFNSFSFLFFFPLVSAYKGVHPNNVLVICLLSNKECFELQEKESIYTWYMHICNTHIGITVHTYVCMYVFIYICWLKKKHKISNL